jgi:D-sedoheptulose 7-phosphate isomerase
MNFTQHYFQSCLEVIKRADQGVVDQLVDLIVRIRDQGGRLFIIGVGGGAGHAGHAVCDFRKIAGIEAYAPSDNVSELTARTNDEGWDTTYAEWLKTSRLGERDMVLVFSVGGGDLARNVSPNLVRALQHAQSVKARIGGIVGRDGGLTARIADVCVVVPTVDAKLVTALTESFQAVIWHLIISHPKIQKASMKWEGMTK